MIVDLVPGGSSWATGWESEQNLAEVSVASVWVCRVQQPRLWLGSGVGPGPRRQAGVPDYPRKQT